MKKLLLILVMIIISIFMFGCEKKTYQKYEVKDKSIVTSCYNSFPWGTSCSPTYYLYFDEFELQVDKQLFNDVNVGDNIRVKR